MAEPAVVTPPPTKYSPRASAADFMSSLPQLGVDTAPPPADVPPPPEPPKAAAVPPPATEPPKAAASAPPPTAPVAVVEVKMPRTAKDWDAFKAAEKTRLEAKEAEISKYKNEIEALKKVPSTPPPIADDDPRILTHKKEAEELSEKLRMVEITQHPKFKAFYEGKVNAQIEMAKRIVGADSSEAIAKLLKLPDNEYRQGKIDELVSTLSPIQQSRVGAVLNSLNEIEVEREGQIEQAKKDYVAYQEKAKTNAELKQKEAMTKAETAFNSVLSTLQNPQDKDGLFIFQKQEGNEEWNKGVEERAKYAKEMLFGQQPPEALIRAALHAAALPGVVKAYKTLMSQVQGLQDQVRGMTAAQPKIEGGKPPEGGDKGAAKPKGNSKFLGGREQAADWIKTVNQTGEE
jgi:hypothetical protein